MDYYDLAIIGAGWAGFNAAITAEQLGLKVALIEKDKLGGTCLNRGCIPTKALIQSAKIYSLAKKSAKFGIQADNLKINFPEIQKRKEEVVSQLYSGMQFTLKSKKINFIKCQAKIVSPEELLLGTEEIKAKNIIIATGSQPTELPDLKFDRKKIISSDDILNLKVIPKSLLIIGGGVIGCEFAGLFSALGSTVTIVELMPQLLPTEDREVAKKLETIFKKRGIKVNTNTDAKTVNQADFDLILVAVGRKPCIDNAEEAGIRLEKNRIHLDEYLRTSISNIYAAGDATGSIMLAHYASYQGTLIAQNLANPTQMKKIDNSAIPNCIFTDPEIASVGLTEDKGKQAGIDIQISKFDFQASGMARILDETEGFIKIISDKKTKQIIGASIVGPKATELIAILTLAIKSRLKVSQIKETVFAHPTLSESIHECLKS
ncbi:MAG: dihydrolipoyl dehydrogenase [Candidatus Omnitrophota bacterium]|nr:dihydrolipoyl dehydrogenase [Candidatus Omnitrophota bacterium]